MVFKFEQIFSYIGVVVIAWFSVRHTPPHLYHSNYACVWSPQILGLRPRPSPPTRHSASHQPYFLPQPPLSTPLLWLLLEHCKVVEKSNHGNPIKHCCTVKNTTKSKTTYISGQDHKTGYLIVPSGFLVRIYGPSRKFCTYCNPFSRVRYFVPASHRVLVYV